MISIIAYEYSNSVKFLCEKFDQQSTKYNLFVSAEKQSVVEFLQNTAGKNAIILVGNVGDLSTLFADTFGLSMFYDKFAEKNISEKCLSSNIALPPQHVLDKLCIVPESFNHFAVSFGVQSACFGEYNKKPVFILPDDERECAVVYENYLVNSLIKHSDASKRFCFKIFGLSSEDIQAKLSSFTRFVSIKCETSNLDSKILLTFSNKCSKIVIVDIINKFKKQFEGFIYNDSDKSLAQTVVELLGSLHKNMSTAESITGGMIASSIVDIAGASSVLYESVVTYNTMSKCTRLGLNANLIDKYGVVSQQVAQQMAVSLFKNGSDLAVSTTGFAGPTSENNLPVGLCYIGIATEKGIKVFKNVFAGDRNSIRAQAANMALFLVYKTFTNNF